MSCSYAENLSPYENKGVLGQREIFDSKEVVQLKSRILAEWISDAKHIVVHTGAGISTSAGIPDFRGPNGVWTLETKGLKPEINISFDDAKPTKTHMALKKLIETNKIQYIVSQNIDGLHLKSGIPRNKIAELHGNMFTEQCNSCDKQFVRRTATTSVGLKLLGHKCPGKRKSGRNCRGKIYDTILDWEHNLPDNDKNMAEYNSSVAELNICLGTTLQINPSGNIPLRNKRYNSQGKLIICNLQPTFHDKRADLIINYYVDDVMSIVMNELNLKIDEYCPEKDPVLSDKLVDWTLTDEEVDKMEKIFENKCFNKKKIKLNQNIENCIEKLSSESVYFNNTNLDSVPSI